MNNKPYRYAVQILVSTLQIYGTLIYFWRIPLGDIKYINLDPLIFWGYLMNFYLQWMIFPGLMIWQAFGAITEAFSAKAPVNKKRQ